MSRDKARLSAGRSDFGGHGLRRYQVPLAAAALALLALSMRFALLPVSPIPLPRWHDEFSYLLAADTFAHGRLTNPTPPAADFLETFHVLVRPTYMSKYPVAQGLVLAAGQVLFGHPWWGVLLSAGAMCAAVFWAVRGWLPLRWALLGGLAVALRYGAADYFVDSYWGGAVAATGGALVLGAAGRLLGRGGPNAHPLWNGLLLGAGGAILLHSRPWEGFLFCVPFAAALVARAAGGTRMVAARSLAAALPPLVLAGAFLLYDSARVTGSAWKLPHRAYDDQYGAVSMFLIGRDSPAPPSRHLELRRFFTEWEPAALSPKTGRFAGDWAVSVARWLRRVRPLASAWVAAIAVAVLSRGRRLGLPIAALAFFTAGLGLQRYELLHYAAPALPLFVALLAAALREVILRTGRAAPPLIRGSFALAAVLFGVGALSISARPVDRAVSLRRSIEDVLGAKSGAHVVVVRYAADHDVHFEFVYNGADVPGAKVIWLREPPEAERAVVAAAFPGRRFWLLEPDRSGRLRPYPAAPSGLRGRTPRSPGRARGARFSRSPDRVAGRRAR
jgi:hypothetical protein